MPAPGPPLWLANRKTDGWITPQICFASHWGVLAGLSFLRVPFLGGFEQNHQAHHHFGGVLAASHTSEASEFGRQPQLAAAEGLTPVWCFKGNQGNHVQPEFAPPCTSRAGEAGGRKFQKYKNYSYLSLSFLDSFSLLLPFH